MDKPLSIVSLIGESFYSAPAYRVVQRWRGKAFSYLGVVLVILWAPVLLVTHVKTSRAVRTGMAALMPQIPVIRFENGHITTPESRPYLFTVNAATPTVFAIIDTSGKFSSLDGQTTPLLLTRDTLFVRQRTGEIKMFNFSNSRARPFVVDAAYISNIGRMVRHWVLPVLYVGIVVLSYIKRLVQAFFLALLGLGISTILEVELDLGELLNLAIVSMTPAMVLETIVAVLGRRLPGEWLIWSGIILAYFIFSVNCASDVTEPQEL